MSKQSEFWSGDGGNEYVRRNRVDWRKRIQLWTRIIDMTGARSVSELGCNAGWNLSAIKRAFPDVSVFGVDINESAIDEALSAGLNVFHGHSGWMECADLSFTAGVLIHIHPDDLHETMANIVDASYDYVLAVEYASESGEEEAIEYRGQSDLLWRRNYGKLYQDMGLELVDKFDAGDAFDRCTAWLLRKA